MLVLSPKRHLRSTLTAAIAVGALTVGVSSSHAGLSGVTMEIDVNVQGGGNVFSSGQVALPLNFNVGDFFQYTADSVFASPDFDVSGLVNANNDILNGGLSIAPTLNFINNSSDILEFHVRIMREAEHSNGVNWTSSAGLTLGGGNGQVFSSLAGESIWTVGIDGADVGAMFDDPSAFQSNGDGTVSLGTDPISGSHGPVSSNMFIDFAFSLTPGADGGLNGIFVLTPAPGSLALLAFAGVCGRRRRRH